MAHTFASLYTHIIFSTKDRLPLLTAELRPDLPAYMGGIIRNLNGKVIQANARPDHVHFLLALPPSQAVADALRVLKTNSSAWIHETTRRAAFAWQTGYGAFSVSQSNVPAVVKYIRDQDLHHRKVTFQEEFITFLKRHGIEYDDRYIWEYSHGSRHGLFSAAPPGLGARMNGLLSHGSRHGLFSVAPPGLLGPGSRQDARAMHVTVTIGWRQTRG